MGNRGTKPKIIPEKALKDFSRAQLFPKMRRERLELIQKMHQHEFGVPQAFLGNRHITKDIAIRRLIDHGFKYEIDFQYPGEGE